VIGIGETGLDYFYDHSDRQVQQDLFRTHIRVGRKTGLPLIIHTRNAEEDTARILSEEMEQEAFPALIHCFTATAEFGRQVLDLGLTISISGIVTFKNARELQEFVQPFPMTDCWWKRIHRSWRLCLIAERFVNRPIRRIRRALSPDCAV
jgi:TatD DNase family protein